jgi:RNA polymerase sigma-70 factor (ECF subfamily)
VSTDDDIRQLLDAGRLEEAFGLALEEFKDKVFRLCCSLLHNETQAEDIAQEVFVKIWKGLRSFRSGASLSTWIYTITRNTCFTELKKRANHPTVSLHESAVAAASEDFSALQSSDSDPGCGMDVELLLAALPARYRTVITLFYFEERAYEEVAAMLGIPLGTVKTLLFRAKKELLKIGARQNRNVPAPIRVPERKPQQIGHTRPGSSLFSMGSKRLSCS